MIPSNRTDCLSVDQLELFLSERLDESSEAAVQDHIGSCASCRQSLERLAADPELWSGIQDDDIDIQRNADRDHEDAVDSALSFLAPTDDPAFAGKLAHYEVSGVIGRGSTGIVLKAWERRLNRYVAIKVLTPSLAAHGPARKRFEREGRAVAAVSHQHVVPIYAVDEFQGLPYIVMQYVPGLSLLQRVDKEGTLATCEVVRIGFQVASGLAAAHAQGIVHRDVKPANVLLENTVDRAMVTDFGLARVASEATMTHSGTISGTPQFMSPEQARGEAVDPRSDLFSLGSLLYAACTSRAPFRADTVFGIIHRVCESEPRPVREVNPEIEQWLADFISKLMSKSTTERFQSASEVATLLEAELAHLQNPTQVPQPAREWQRAATKATLASTDRATLWRRGPRVAVAGILAASVIGAMWTQREWLLESFQPADISPVVLAGSDGEVDPMPSAGPLDESPTSITKKLSPAEDGTDADLRASSAGRKTKTSEGRVPGAAASEDSSGSLRRYISTFAALSPGQDDQVQWSHEANEQSIVQGFQQRIDRSFDIDDGKLVRLAVDRGQIEIRQTELDYASLVILRRIEAANQAEAEKIAGQFVVTQTESGDGWQCDVALDEAFLERKGDRKIAQVVYGLSLPANTMVEVETERGNVVVDPIIADVAATTDMGSVVFHEVEGDQWARATGGEIVSTSGSTGRLDFMATHGNVCVAGVKGSARLRATDGVIYVGKNDGPVSAHATGGSIRIASLNSETSAHVGGGEIRLRLSETPKAKAKLSSAGGDISIELPSNSAVDFRANGQLLDAPDLEWNASVEAESIVDEAASLDSTAQTWKESSLNEGGVPIQMLASSGRIQIALVEQDGTNGYEEGLGGSGDSYSLGGSGNYFSLGGSGSHSQRVSASQEALAKTRGEPRAGAMVPISIEDGGNIDGYTLYLPVSYETDSLETYPVILYLTGGYGVGGPITRLNDWGLPRLLRDESDTDSERNQLLLDTFIVVSLHIQGGDYDDHPDVVQRILDEVGSQYRADTDRIYVTGLSRGGHASWNIIEKLPGVFAATVPIGGTPRLDDYSAFETTAVWVAHNRRDPVVEWVDADQAAGQIEETVGKLFLRLDRPLPREEEVLDEPFVFTEPDLDRHDAWTDLYTSEVFYRWLLCQTLSPVEVK
ncbi:MAG: protein kinase domain-containing protein [Aureliella sp.]